MMAQAIVTVLILLIFVGYAVLFAMWNAGMMTVIGWNLWPQPAWAEVPIFIVPLAGVVIGAIVMAIAISAPWSSLKSRLNCAEEQLETARERSKECQQKVQELRSRLQKVEAQKRAASGAAESPPADGSKSGGDA